MDQITLVLIGDAARRARVKQHMAAGRAIRVAGKIGHGSALHLVPRLGADIVVVDCAAEAINSQRVIAWLHQLPTPPRVIALADRNTEAERALALEAGADAYITLDTPAALTRALRLMPITRDTVRPEPALYVLDQPMPDDRLAG